MKIVLIYILIRTDSISTSQRFHYHNGIWINTAGGNEMRLITEYEEMKRKKKQQQQHQPKCVHDGCSFCFRFSFFLSTFHSFRFLFLPMFLCQLKLIRAHEGWSWSLKKWIDSNFIMIYKYTYILLRIVASWFHMQAHTHTPSTPFHSTIERSSFASMVNHC